MAPLLALGLVLLAGDPAARRAERQRALSPVLGKFSIKANLQASTVELLRGAPPFGCEPITEGISLYDLRCGQVLPTSDAELCWHGAFLATLMWREQQLEDGNEEGALLSFRCSTDTIDGQVREMSVGGPLAGVFELKRASDGRSVSAQLPWQVVKLDAGDPRLYLRLKDPALRRVRKEWAIKLKRLNEGKSSEAMDLALACARAHKELAALPAFRDDESLKKALVDWVDAVAADDGKGPLAELDKRAGEDPAKDEARRKKPVTARSPLAALPTATLVERFKAGVQERDGALVTAMQAFITRHPLK